MRGGGGGGKCLWEVRGRNGGEGGWDRRTTEERNVDRGQGQVRGPAKGCHLPPGASSLPLWIFVT